MAAAANTSMRNGAENYITSDSDDESFVVLGRSLPYESLLEIKKDDCVDVLSTEIVQSSINSAKEAMNELSRTEASEKLPSLPNEFKLNDLPGRSLMCAADTTINGTNGTNSNVSSLSQDEIQQKVEGLIEENSRLKDALIQNHLTLKRQYDTIALWNEDVQKVHKVHKEKFAETKAYVEKLKENLQVAEATISCLRGEISSLKGEDPNIKALNVELYKTTFDNLNKFELEAAQNKIRVLEEQLSRMQISSPPEDSLGSLREELLKVKEVKNQIEEERNMDHKQSVIKQSRLINEIESLKQILTQKSESDEEIINNLKEQLMSSQIQITELQDERRKNKEIIQQKDAELSDYKRGIQSLEARVIDPAIVVQKDNEILLLKTTIQNLREELELVPVLQQQLDIFKADFEAEREAKNALKSQKEAAAEDLGHLQRRNQQLLEEVERLRVIGGGNRGGASSASRPVVQEQGPAASQEPSPPPQRYSCPLCMKSFKSVRFLEDHVDLCLGTTDGTAS